MGLINHEDQPGDTAPYVFRVRGRYFLIKEQAEKLALAIGAPLAAKSVRKEKTLAWRERNDNDSEMERA